MKKVSKAVILCGGLATRFLPICKSIPKEMLPLLDKPILQVIVEDLSKAGITDIFILVGRGKECILNHFDKNVELENALTSSNKLEELETIKRINGLANITYKRQIEPRGTGAGIEMAKSFIGDDPFVLMFGDEVMLCEKENIVEQLLDTFQEENVSTIAIKEVPLDQVYKYGIISPGKEIKHGYYVNSIVEKPSIKLAPSNLSYIGASILTKDIFPALEKLKVNQGKEKCLTNAFAFLCDENKLCARIIDGQRHDMGDKFGFVKANIDACLRDERYGNEMKDFIIELAKKLSNNK